MSFVVTIVIMDGKYGAFTAFTANKLLEYYKAFINITPHIISDLISD